MIIPSIDLQSGKAVQLIGGKEFAVDGGDPMAWAREFGIAGEIVVIDLDAALGTGNNRETILGILKDHRCRVGGGIRTIEDALFYLDRGALQDTVIEDGVKLDNLIQVGHNVRIGRNTAIAGCAGIAGSAIIGRQCTIGGGAIVLGHLEIAAHVHISAGTLVSKSIRKPGHYTGIFPLDENANWERNAASLKQLHRLRERIKQLESDAKK